MNLTPNILFLFIDIDIVFLFGHVLNASENKDIIIIIQHGMSSSALDYYKITSGDSLVYILVHLFSFTSYFQKSFKVFLPLEPPNIQIFP